LKLIRAGIRRSAQDEQTTIFLIPKRIGRLCAQERVERYGVRLHNLEDEFDVSRIRRSDVSALRVQDDWHLRRPCADVSDRLHESLDACRASCFVKGGVRLVSADKIRCRVDYATVELNLWIS
jgi:hypothetical protein